jgi:hypothetical protein
MSAPTYSRPFDMAAARAGAPFCGAQGQAVRVLIWDRKHPTHPIIIMEEDGEQEAIAMRANGTTEFGAYTARELVMLPLGLIDGRPVFVADRIEQRDHHNESWVARDAQPEDRDFSTSRWPAPAKVYPQTQMSDDDLRHAAGMNHNNMTMTLGHLHSAANAALRHAVDTSQVVDAERSTEAIRKAYADGQAIAYKHEGAARAERDMAIVRATVLACKARFNTGPLDMYSGENVITRLSGIHPKSAIATVK